MLQFEETTITGVGLAAARLQMNGSAPQPGELPADPAAALAALAPKSAPAALRRVNVADKRIING